MNVLIPMAGRGSRFEKVGYQLPKPVIDVNGKPMIQVAVENLNLKGNYIFIVLKEHCEKYNIESILKKICNNCKIIITDKVTEGPACTTLLAKEYINSKFPLLIANCDQYLEWNSDDFINSIKSSGADGGILTFKDDNPKWSFVKINEDGFVTEVAEKNPISNIATAGIYYWESGDQYVKFAEQMIEKDVRVNNEFYVCPVYNEAINSGLKFITHDLIKMWGLGTPEDLNYFIKNKK